MPLSEQQPDELQRSDIVSLCTSTQSHISEEDLSNIVSNLVLKMQVSPEIMKESPVIIEKLGSAIHSLTENIKKNSQLSSKIIHSLSETSLPEHLESIKRRSVGVKNSETMTLYLSKELKPFFEWYRDITIGVTTVNIAMGMHRSWNLALFLLTGLGYFPRRNITTILNEGIKDTEEKLSKNEVLLNIVEKTQKKIGVLYNGLLEALEKVSPEEFASSGLKKMISGDRYPDNEVIDEYSTLTLR
jgi:hypothetical protein